MRSQQGKAFRAEGQRQGRPGKAQPATAPCDLSKAFRAESQRQGTTRQSPVSTAPYADLRQGQDSLNRNASSKERAVETHRLEPRQAVRFVEVLLYQLLQGTLARALRQISQRFVIVDLSDLQSVNALVPLPTLFSTAARSALH
jgi:hypothetical protein